MENKQNFFENWMNNQKTMMENWIQVGKNLQDNAKNQTNSTFNSFDQNNPAEEWMNRSKEMMSEWQKNLNSWNESAQNQNSEKMNEMGDTYKNWMETQKSAIENWSNQIKNVMQQSNQNMNNTMNNWNNSNNWMGMAQNWQKNMMDSAFSNNSNWMNNFQNMGFNWNNDTVKNVFNNIGKNSEIFNSMQNMWNEFQKNASSGMNQNWNEYFTPSYMKSVMDKMFGFDISEMQKSMFVNYNKSTEMFKPMMEQFQSYGNNFSSMLNNQQNPFGNWMTETMKQMSNNYAPFFKVMAPGKDKSMIENTNQIVEKYVAFIEKSNELQVHYYKTAYSSMETVMADYQKMAEEGKNFDTFQEFFNHWNKITESNLVNLFDTDEYTKLQGELMNLDLELKSLNNQQMELALENFPIMLKKDMDEVYMSNYELRKRVRSLEKEMENLRNSSNSNTPELVSSSEETQDKKVKTAPTAKK